MCQNCKKPYYITTAIAYTSGKPHIGNTYEIVLADSIARYKRAQGYDVRFQTGTDEHGQKIELKADEAGITPKQFVDNVAGEIKTIWDLMNTSYAASGQTGSPSNASSDAASEQARFDAFLAHQFQESVQDDPLSLHFLVRKRRRIRRGFLSRKNQRIRRAPGQQLQRSRALCAAGAGRKSVSA